jgi:hypothetical protein
MSGRHEMKRGAGLSSDDMSEYDSLMPQRGERGSTYKKRKTLRTERSRRQETDMNHENPDDSIISEGISLPKDNDSGGEIALEVSGSESEDDSQPVVSHRRRRPTCQPDDRHSQASCQERADLEADLADLDASSLSQPVFDKSRSSARSASLAELKAKRLRKSQGLPSLTPNELSSQNNEEKYVARTEFTTASDMFDTDTDDGEFVEQDIEPAISTTAEDDVLCSTRISSMDLKDLWPHAIRWMVNKTLDLHVEEDKRFRRAFERLDNEPSGLVRSKHNSSSWTPSFTAILARPKMVSAEATSEYETCDACGHKCYSVVFEVRFYGRLYCRETLDASDGHDNINGHGQDRVNSFGPHVSGASVSQTKFDEDQRLLSDHRVWHLGGTCVRKAKVSHNLQHWRYHNYSSVANWLTEHGYNAGEQCGKRGEMSIVDKIDMRWMLWIT